MNGRVNQVGHLERIPGCYGLGEVCPLVVRVLEAWFQKEWSWTWQDLSQQGESGERQFVMTVSPKD